MIAKLGQEKRILKAFVMVRYRKMAKILWTKSITNQEVLNKKKGGKQELCNGRKVRRDKMRREVTASRQYNKKRRLRWPRKLYWNR